VIAPREDRGLTRWRRWCIDDGYKLDLNGEVNARDIGETTADNEVGDVEENDRPKCVMKLDRTKIRRRQMYVGPPTSLTVF